MKALLVCTDPHSEKFLPLGLNPWLLPVAGKALVEYQLETLGQLGMQEIRLIGADPAVEARYGSGQSLGLKLSYAPLPTQTTLQSLLRHNLSFVAGQPVLLLQGLNLMAPLHASHCLRLTHPVRLGDGLIGLTPQAVAAALKGDFTEAHFAGLSLQTCCESQPLVNLKSYLQANLELSSAWSKRVSLPAYGHRDGFLCGSKLNLAKDLTCRGHGLIGSYSVIQPEVELQDAYLGRGVVVARGTHIRRSVILDGTWIGPHLTIEDKIVVGRRLIDPESGQVVSLTEPGWLDDLKPQSLSTPAARLLASVYWLLMLPLYAWLAPSQNQRLLAYRLPHEDLLLPHFTPGKGWRSRLFERLQLDRVPRLRAVMRKQLALVGQPPMAKGIANPYPEYLPAALAYSDWLGSQGTQALLDNASYPLFRNPRKETLISLQILWRSLTSGTSSVHAVDASTQSLLDACTLPDSVLLSGALNAPWSLTEAGYEA